MLARSNQKRFATLLVVLAALTVLAALAWTQPSVAWAGPNAQGTVPTGGAICQSGATCTTASGNELTIPAGSFPSDSQVRMRVPSSDEVHAAEPGSVLVGQPYIIELFDVQGNLVEHPVFNPPLTLCFKETAADIENAGGHSDNIDIGFYNTATGHWEVLVSSEVTEQNDEVCTSISHLTLFSMLAQTPGALPVTGGAANSQSLLFVVAGLALVIGLVAFFRLRRPIA